MGRRTGVCTCSPSHGVRLWLSRAFTRLCSIDARMTHSRHTICLQHSDLPFSHPWHPPHCTRPSVPPHAKRNIHSSQFIPTQRHHHLQHRHRHRTNQSFNPSSSTALPPFPDLDLSFSPPTPPPWRKKKSSTKGERGYRYNDLSSPLP